MIIGCILITAGPTLVGNDWVVSKYVEVLPTSFYEYCLNKEELAAAAETSLEKGQILYTLSQRTGVHNGDLTLDYQQTALEIFQSVQHDSLEHMVTASMCFPLIEKGLYDEAETVIKKALNYWESIGNRKWSIATNSKYGFLELSRGNYFKALEHYLESHRRYLTYSDKKKMGGNYNMLGIIYQTIGDCETSLKYLEEFLDECRKSDQPLKWETTVRTNAAKCYKELGQDSIARMYYEMTNDKWLSSSSRKFKAHAYIRKGQYAQEDGLMNQAKIYLDSAIYHANLFGASKTISNTFYAKYEFNNQRGDKKAALEDLKKSYEYAKRSEYISRIQSCAEGLSELYREQGALSKSIQFDTESDSLRKKLFTEDIAKQIKLLDIRIQEEQSEQKLSLLEEQNRLKEQNILSQKKSEISLLD